MVPSRADHFLRDVLQKLNQGLLGKNGLTYVGTRKEHTPYK